jgi:hypothetical protein
MSIETDKCSNLDCPCNKPKTFWLELDDNENPTGKWEYAYYPDDKPMSGKWIKVVEWP